MKKPTQKRYWRIEGFDSMQTIFKTRLELGQFTDERIKALLRALAAKAGLTYEETVGAYAKPRTKIANSLLQVHYDSRHTTYICGGNPHFAAWVVDESNNMINPPTLR